MSLTGRSGHKRKYIMDEFGGNVFNLSAHILRGRVKPRGLRASIIKLLKRYKGDLQGWKERSGFQDYGKTGIQRTIPIYRKVM